MANRYPLVINNSTSLVGELPTGDSLNLTAAGIFDGTSTGANSQVLTSNNGYVKWARAADVFLSDNQTLLNKTLSSCTFNASLNVLTNIANSSLINSSININNTPVSLGGSITIPDTNDNTIYSISIADGINALQKRIRLTAGGSGSGVQDIFLTTNGNYLTLGRTNNDTLSLNVSIQNLTAGSYIIYDNSATIYNGLNARTIAVNASTIGNSNVVARDGNGNFSAGTITANITGNVTGNLTGTADKVANSLVRGLYLTGNDYNGSATTTWAVDAAVGTESARGGNKIIARDSNGDFWARNISGSTIRATVSVTVDRGTNPHGFLRSDGSIDTSDYVTLSEVPEEFPSGTQMIFRQSSAPTGWTKKTDTSLSNAALRVVTTFGGGTGGVNGFTDSLNTSINDGATCAAGTLSGTTRYTGSHTLTSSQLVSHTHSPSIGGSFFIRAPSSNGEAPLNAGNGGSFTETFGGTGSTTSEFTSSGHSHTISTTFDRGSFNLNVKYTDVIIAQKD